MTRNPEQWRGWTQCYWCPYWVYNPYIIDWIGRPLCNWCFDWHIGNDGGPYEPNARQRTALRLRIMFENKLPNTACDTIADMLRDWHEP